ncbi:GAF domain-containing protein, partial [bacterium]|nr:GAF domain-containing protein [bacterium]
ESAIVVPLAVRDRSIGELMLTSKKIDFFNNFDLQVVSTAASQLATAVEGASLSTQTDEGLRRRVDQLTAMTRISRELNTTLEWKYLLQVVYDESLRTTRADCGAILLLDLDEDGSGAPKVMFRLGDEQPEADLLPIEQAVLGRGEPILVTQFESHEFQPAHDGVRSALVVPIAYQGKTVGLIHLHSLTASRFDQTALEIIQTLAVQAAIALGNAQRFQEQVRRNELLNRRADTLSHLFETASSLNVDQPVESSLESLAYGIQEATPFQIVLISVIEPESMMQRRVAGVGMPLETLNMLKAHQQPWEALSQLLRPEFKIGMAYFVPYDQRPLVSSEVQIVTFTKEQTTLHEQNAWNPEDSLFFPLNDISGNPVGLISLDAPRDGQRPDRTTLETVEIFAAQAALIIQSTRRLSKYQTQVETLSTSLDRQ